MMKVAVLFHRLGPYHHARLRAAGQALDVTAIELSAADDTYAWAEVSGAEGFSRQTLFQKRDVVHEPGHRIIKRLHSALDKIQPDAVAIPGWSDRGALAALVWCLRCQRSAVIMSESTAYDELRTPWKEAIKSRIVRLCAAGLVGGQPHVDYLASLGMPRERIFTGYDVVDNPYFAAGADTTRRAADKIRQRYFLASGRFIGKKNFEGLLDAYAKYYRQRGNGAWDLVILGDGKLRSHLERRLNELGIVERVHLPGFKQYDELSIWYGLADAFIHASTTEQWGLVVNEAMAAGLPVLVSNRCGCAPDLVEEGQNGFVFDPYDTNALAMLMARLSNGDCDIEGMGKRSQQIMERWTPRAFAMGLEQAVSTARRGVRQSAGLADRVLLHLLFRADQIRFTFAGSRRRM